MRSQATQPSATPIPAPAQPAAAAPRTPTVVPREQTIPLTLALAAANAAIDFCAKNDVAIAVLIVDMNDDPKLLLAADGSKNTLAEFARRKAYTVMKKGVSSGDFAKSLNPPPERGQIVEGDPDLMAAAGGLPIRKGNVLLGAIAVSGGAPTMDAACAEAGLVKIKF